VGAMNRFRLLRPAFRLSPTLRSRFSTSSQAGNAGNVSALHAAARECALAVVSATIGFGSVALFEYQFAPDHRASERHTSGAHDEPTDFGARDEGFLVQARVRLTEDPFDDDTDENIMLGSFPAYLVASGAYYFFARRLGYSVLWRSTPLASPLASLGVVAMLSAPVIAAVLTEISTSLDDWEADRLEALIDGIEDDDLEVSLSWNFSFTIGDLRMLVAEPVEEELFFRLLFFGRLLHFCGPAVAYPLAAIAFVPLSRDGGIFGLCHALLYAASYHYTGRLVVPCVLHALEVCSATYFTQLIESFLDLPLPSDDQPDSEHHVESGKGLADPANLYETVEVDEELEE